MRRVMPTLCSRESGSLLSVLAEYLSMKAYHIVDRRIMLRDHQGDLFEFALGEDADKGQLHLVGRPVWKDGVVPRDAAIRIDVAALQARDIARQTGMVRKAAES